MNDRHLSALAADRTRIDLVLSAGARLGPFEVQRLIARGKSSFVYMATDHALAMPVAIQEYLPMRMVYRDAWLHLHPNDAWQEDMLSRGMQVFIEESRLLARCEHPALVRVNHLFEANGTAYRVMPFYPGQRLSDWRNALGERPAEAPLRALLEPLLGALETIHRLDRVHGGVFAENILVNDGDSPLLLSPGGAANEIRSDLVDSLMAAVESQPGALLPEPSPAGAAADLRALAEVMRFCVTGDGSPASRPREPLETLIARQAEGSTWPVYSSEFIGTLDAATSSFPEDWPHSVDQFRLWLTHGTPAARARAPRRLHGTASSPAAPPAVPERSPEPMPPAVASAHPADHDLVRMPAAPTNDPFPLPDMFVQGDPMLAAQARPVETRRRWRGLPAKLLFGGVLAGLAVGIVAWVSGAWNVMPAIALNRDLTASVVRINAPVPPPSHGIQAPPPAALPTAVAPSPATVPAPAPVPATSASTVAPSLDPDRLLSVRPPGAGPGTASPTRATAHNRVAATKATRGPTDLRSACAGRTEFALYRCMKLQCRSPKWSVTPQCVRLRLNDRLE